MPEVTNQSTIRIMRGVPLRFYLDPTINADGTITLNETGALDADAHPDAVELGFTQDGAVFTRGTTFEDLAVDQRFTSILNSLTAATASLKTKVLQVRDWDNLAMLNPGTTVMVGTGFTGISDQVEQTFDLHAVAAVAPTPDDPNTSTVFLLFACYNVAPLDLTLAKKYNVTSIELRAQDAGRADGKTFAVFDMAHA